MPFNSIFAWVIKKRIHQIDLFRKYPVEVQEELFNKLIEESAQTHYGKQFNFGAIKHYQQFKEGVPLQFYENAQPYIQRVIEGEENVLWPGETKWFAKSSGTTADRSKFIPVTRVSLEECHYKGGKDLLALYYNNLPNRKLYNGKHLIVGGSTQLNPLGEDSYLGDLSAIIVRNLPWWAELRRTPAREIALMSNWEEKLERMANETIKEDVYIIAGVPSWTMLLLERILAITGKKHIREVWPNLELFMHGGVSFAPYKEAFERLIPGENMHYVETYNASEGFFGIQDQLDSKELLLMLDYGIFYEFIPMQHFKGTETDPQHVVSIAAIEIGVNYAMVISTNGGLWRYIVGDTIKFTSKQPHRFVITGRTKSYINVFGEELIVENADEALSKACKQHSVEIRDFTAGPVYMEEGKSGRHEWLVEFIHAPQDLKAFKADVDRFLRAINSDYDAKRSNDFILSELEIEAVPAGTFQRWLKSKGKLGGQHKIPRLSNDRSIIEEIKALL